MKRLYTFSGIVIEGKKRGRDLGFPTANIEINQKIPSGIYISWTEIDKTQHPSLTFFGEAKTFNESLFQAETWILDFKENIYNKKITIQLLKKLRENQKFDSVENLVRQMKDDEKKARKYFEESK
jgi:riboflavin kinase/FMN adenylyltransferase